MSDQYFGGRLNPAVIVERTDLETNIPVVDLEPSAEKVAVDAVLFPETPMGGALADVVPMDEAIVHEAPLSETIPNYTVPVVETILYKAPVAEMMTPEAPVAAIAAPSAALLTPEEARDFRTRWNEIQGKFVDEPRSAVQQADGLVSDVVEKITQMFAQEHGVLEGQWKQGNDVSTEDLRKALQRYRTFFNRLVV